MKIATQAKGLLQGQPYTPSWMMAHPTSYTTPRLNGQYGLAVPTIQEGTKSDADPHRELERPA